MKDLINNSEIEPKIVKENSFVKVDKSDYPKLKDVMSRRLPESAGMYNSVILADSNRLSDAMRFYTLNGIIDDSSIIMGRTEIKNTAEDEGFPIVCLSTITPTNLTEESAKAFVDHLEPPDQPWKPIFFNSIRDFAPILIKALLDRGSKVTAISCLETCYLDEIPDGPTCTRSDIIVKPVDPKYAKLLASKWNYGILTEGGTEFTIRQLLENNPSAGVYSLEGELLSWGACYNVGKTAMLFTPEPYRGRGYASEVMKFIVKEFKEKGMVPISTIETRNKASLKTMSKAGFVQTHAAELIFAE